MLRRTLLSLALTVGLALCATVPATAAAEVPEFEGPFPNRLELKSKEFLKGAVLTTVGKHSISCGFTGVSKGEITGGKALSTKLNAGSCSGFGESCSTTATELEGEPVYLNGKSEVGIVLRPKGGGNVFEFSCGKEAGKETVKVRGSVIATVTPVGISTTSFRVTFAGKEGVQKPTEYENEKGEKKKAVLEAEGSGKEAFAFEGADLAWAANMVTTKAIELKAKVLPEFRLGSGGKFPMSFEGESSGYMKFNFYLGTCSFWVTKITGQITGPDEVGHILLTGGLASEGCHFPEKPFTEELSGRVAYTNKATKEVGLLLEEPNGKRFGELAMGGPATELLGSVIATVTPKNAPVTTFEWLYKTSINGGTLNVPKSFEGEEALHDLETRKVSGGETLALGMEGTIKAKTKESVELRG